MKFYNNNICEGRPGSRKHSSGFTLVEAMVGFSLIILVMAGVLLLLKQSNYLTELARDHTRVSQLLQDELDRLRTLGWEDLQEMKEWDTFTPNDRFTSLFGNRFYCYRDVVTTGTSHKDITVVAVWFDSSNQSRTTLYQMRIMNGGINDYYNRTI